jgi:DNA replication ATP-dependent helicase Dna2
MPLLTKQAISTYLRCECQRRLRLELSPDTRMYRPERQAQAMPPRVVARPGLYLLKQAGELWEEAKIHDLAQTFGTTDLVGNAHQVGHQIQYRPVSLASALAAASPGQFIVQAEYSVGNTFENALGIVHYRSTFQLEYTHLRPDLIQLLYPATCKRAILPDGTLVQVQQPDDRIPLRIIDIKLTAEPSVSYLAEITYYAMTLAGWLVDNGLNRCFFVVPEAAVWPGSHDASTLVRLLRDRQAQDTRPTHAELLAALDDDLEEVVFEVFAPRLRRFLREELPRVLSTPWRDLDWHVDNRCIGCDYLGFSWPGVQTNPDHCWPTAIQQDHLSRIAFVSRGARSALEDHQIATVAALAATQPADTAYDSHHTLRSMRTVVSGRATALNRGRPHIPPQSGTSAVMPRWADLRIYLTADFDVGSGITLSFGFQAFWLEPFRTAGTPRRYRSWQAQAFPIGQRDLETERREIIRLLGCIHDALTDANQWASSSTVQVYIWDTVTYEHIVRVIGRHLDAILRDNHLNYLAWLFPPEDILPNPAFATRRSPITIVSDVVRAVVAAPVPHYYSLLNIARSYHSSRTASPWNRFEVPQYFEDPLSDHIPSERGHEIWSRAPGPPAWNIRLAQLERTIKIRLRALESVSQRLGEDLGHTLSQSAPPISDIRAPVLSQRMSADARLWFTFAKLNAALERLQVDQIRAMPPHEREARFHSARLSRRLVGQAATQVLAGFGVAPSPFRRVYELAETSREVRAQENDFSFALAPARLSGILDDTLNRIRGLLNVPIPPWASGFEPMERVCAATIRALDRDSRRIVIELDPDWAPTIDALEAAGRLDLSHDTILDPVHREFFTKRLEDELIALGNPPIANTQPAVSAVLGAKRRPTPSVHQPPADILWDAPRLYAERVTRVIAPIRALLDANGFDLNQSQWSAWEQSLTHRLRLIWGPPGTGKSRTVRTILLGALVEAHRQGRLLRVLLSGPTYEAIDNILLPVYSAITGGPLQIPSVQVARLRSKSRPPDTRVPPAIDVELTTGQPIIQRLVDRLKARTAMTLVAATPQQVYRLLKDAGGAPLQPWFDLILIDEASQMDTATATLVLAGLAPGGSVVVAGDPKQLPPIHQAQPPLHLEYVVGPIFTYLTDPRRHNLQPMVLEENYRSNRAIVELAHAAGYPLALHAVSPKLELALLSSQHSSATPPSNWPSSLHWMPAWTAFLDPSQSAVCFVYPEGRSGQWNQFEADAVAALVWLLSRSLGDQLRNETDPTTGTFRTASNTLYSHSDFWSKGVGVVTPHRAQQALIVSKLQQIFQPQGSTATQIRQAVDTVERFQGQQRDVMLATFALGDPDAIADEDEFLMSLNRFNVMASRARAKLIVFVSQEVVNHLPKEMDVLKQSALLKTYAETFCNNARPMTLGHTVNGALRNVPGTFRWR